MDAPAAESAQTLDPKGKTPWEPMQPCTEQGTEGTSSGINIAPGSDDDGWAVPPHVRLADGTQLQLYKDGEALHAAYDAIRAAQRRICLEVYIFRSDPTGRAFAEALSAKAREGLAVYVIYDSLASMDSDPRMFDDMRAAGVRLEQFHPIKPWECRYSWRLFNRDHRKVLIIDDDMAGLGGLNVGGEYAGSWIVQTPDCDPWRDNAVGVRGPAVRHLLIAFRKAWRYVQRGGRVRAMEYLHDVEGGSDFGVLASVPARKTPLHPLRKLLKGARNSIAITMSYFAPPEELIDDLCRAARRKVRVRLMLPGRGDVKLLMIAARAFYEKLMAAGVEVYERQGAILHAKTMCVDGYTTVIGSTNLDYRSIEYNTELSVIIRNEQFGRQVNDLFDNDVKFARRMTLREWRRRPWGDKFVQWAVSRARYLL